MPHELRTLESHESNIHRPSSVGRSGGPSVSLRPWPRRLPFREPAAVQTHQPLEIGESRAAIIGHRIRTSWDAAHFVQLLSQRPSYHEADESKR